MINNLLTAARGFTLIEMLVSVLLLTLAIVGPLTISSKALTVALVAKDQTIAFYLAQDAVEYVRYARDTNTLCGGDWLLGGGSGTINLGPCVSSNGAARCRIDSLGFSPTIPTACGATGCGRLYYQGDTNNYYNYNSGAGSTPTIFTRTISIQNDATGTALPPTPPAYEAVLRVSVSWSDIAGVTRTITVTEDLFDWQ